MSIPDVSGTPGPSRPSRSGQPWAEEDYQTLVRLCRDGADLDTIAHVLGRRDTSVLERARRMLPVDERGLPRDRALTQLRRRLEDDGYDWAHQLTQSPSLPPMPAPLMGIAGLDDSDLLAAAHNLATRNAANDPYLARDLAQEILRRGLKHRLRELAFERTKDCVGDFLGEPHSPYSMGHY